MHWVSVARRMKFSRQQKAHFKLALRVFYPPGHSSSRIWPDYSAGDTQLRIPAGPRKHRSKAAQQ